MILFATSLHADVYTDYMDGNAYALGMQYGFYFGAINIKGSHKGNNEYILGSGLVVEF